MNQRCAKTDAGRDEIKNRSRKLSRPARNLLLVMDTTHTAQDWLHLVHGASEDDLQQLLAEGLIEGKDDSQAPRVVAGASLADALARLPYDQLYSLLTSQARERFGLALFGDERNARDRAARLCEPLHGVSDGGESLFGPRAPRPVPSAGRKRSASLRLR